MTDQPPVTEPVPSNVMLVGNTQVRILAVPLGKNPVTEMLQSKKFLAMVAGMIFTLLSKVGVDISAESQEQVLNLVMVYIGAQGVADAGHGFARSKNAQPPPPVQAAT